MRWRPGLDQGRSKEIRTEGTDGYDLVLRSNAPPGSGLGASSTMIVARTGLLARHYVVGFNDYNIAGLAYAIEREGLDIAGGMQATLRRSVDLTSSGSPTG